MLEGAMQFRELCKKSDAEIRSKQHSNVEVLAEIDVVDKSDNANAGSSSEKEDELNASEIPNEILSSDESDMEWNINET